MAIPPSTVAKPSVNEAATIAAAEAFLDAKTGPLQTRTTFDVVVPLAPLGIFDLKTAEALAQLYRGQGWHVSVETDASAMTLVDPQYGTIKVEALPGISFGGGGEIAIP